MATSIIQDFSCYTKSQRWASERLLAAADSLKSKAASLALAHKENLEDFAD
jgi:hypothetical protein